MTLSDWIELGSAIATAGGVTVAWVFSARSLKAAEVQARIATKAFDETRRLEGARRQSRETALRAALVSVLNDTAEWAKKVSRVLGDMPSGKIEAHHGVSLEIDNYPRELEDAMVRMIEATDNEHVMARLSRMLGNIQIITARVRGAQWRRRRTKLEQDQREGLILNCATVYAQAVGLLQWARRDVEAISARVSWGEIGSSLLSMSIHSESIKGRVEQRESRDGDPETL